MGVTALEAFDSCRSSGANPLVLRRTEAGAPGAPGGAPGAPGRRKGELPPPPGWGCCVHETEVYLQGVCLKGDAPTGPGSFWDKMREKKDSFVSNKYWTLFLQNWTPMVQ